MSEYSNGDTAKVALPESWENIPMADLKRLETKVNNLQSNVDGFKHGSTAVGKAEEADLATNVQDDAKMLPSGKLLATTDGTIDKAMNDINDNPIISYVRNAYIAKSDNKYTQINFNQPLVGKLQGCVLIINSETFTLVLKIKHGSYIDYKLNPLFCYTEQKDKDVIVYSDYKTANIIVGTNRPLGVTLLLNHAESNIKPMFVTLTSTNEIPAGYREYKFSPSDKFKTDGSVSKIANNCTNVAGQSVMFSGAKQAAYQTFDYGIKE